MATGTYWEGAGPCWDGAGPRWDRAGPHCLLCVIERSELEGLGCLLKLSESHKNSSKTGLAVIFPKWILLWYSSVVIENQKEKMEVLHVLVCLWHVGSQAHSPCTELL